MPINYALFQNNLTADPNDYAAQTQIIGSVELDAIAQRVIDQGSTVTKADILAVLEDTIKATEGFLLEGYRVQMGGLCELFPRVKGVFAGITDTFDPARHRVDVGANPGNRVRKTVRENATVTKQETITPEPSPLEYVDLGSGEINNTLTSGNIGTVNGHRLKFDPAQADEGIFLIDMNNAATQVDAVQKNKPGQLVFLVPAGLPPAVNPFHVEVRARFSDGGDLRTGRLDAPLTAV